MTAIPEQPPFLPMTRQEMASLGWKELDVLLVTGDAHVDHPSFGAPLLGRYLVSLGYRTGIIAQPDWTSPEAVAAMGRPRLFAGVTAGALDSMLAHYTAFRKKRSDDAYTPGGMAGRRPNRAALVYTNLVRRAFPGLFVVLGGIEASLRRISHFDFWSDQLRKSILLDSKADLILYGMAEQSLAALAALLDAGGGDTPAPHSLAVLPGAVFAGQPDDIPRKATTIALPSHESILAEPQELMQATLALERHVHQADHFLIQECAGRTVILTPPAEPDTGEQLDALYGLPFSRRPHPSYTESIPAADMIRDSITSHRGCAGGCSFCALAIHQGRRIRSRSRESILAEARSMAGNRSRGVAITDVGGPSAAMWGARCAADPGRCKRASCLTPGLCRHFKADQAAYLRLLRELQRLDCVRSVRVASGLRMDLALAEPEAARTIVREFTGGQLKVAPEHISQKVLERMRKPGRQVFLDYLDLFDRESRRAGKEQYVVPYLMSAFPGCTEQDMRELADWLGVRGWKPQQVQCFIPLPSTVAAAMYYSGRDAEGNEIHVARSDAQRQRQHRILIPSTRGPRRPVRRKGGQGGTPSGQRKGQGSGQKKPKTPRQGQPDNKGPRGNRTGKGRGRGGR